MYSTSNLIFCVQKNNWFNNVIPILHFFCIISFFQCSSQSYKVVINNTLNFERNEIVTIERNSLKQLLKYPEAFIQVKNLEDNTYSPTQWVDTNSDGTLDELLFEAKVPAKSPSYYCILIDSLAKPETIAATYSRFIPERSDDYAWENDKIAFRVYGPKGQQEALQGIAGSTLSSGVDIWLKRVSYPIIDKWYKEHQKSPGYYHTDHGEGYDPYHVGKSRGTGGTGIWVKDSLLVSENFIKYKTIANGPLRTIFELEYAPWSDDKISETKRISLDKGSNFSKFEIKLTSSKQVLNYAIGISLHENKGDVKINSKEGTFRNLEFIDGSFVGEGIVLAPSEVKTAFTHISKTTDQNHLLVVTKPTNKLIYFAGFVWQKSGQVTTLFDWDNIIEKQALIIANPLKLKITNK
jgi:hypothetical protein